MSHEAQKHLINQQTQADAHPDDFQSRVCSSPEIPESSRSVTQSLPTGNSFLKRYFRRFMPSISFLIAWFILAMI